MKGKIAAFFTACVLSSAITMTSWADDLEIYVGSNQTENIFLPNVLFIMDTSGSMATVDEEDGESRLLRVQNALTDVLSSATNLNAGLMRFSNEGGPILYPVANLDDSVATDLTYTVNNGDNDAQEVDGRVNLDNASVTISQASESLLSGFRFENVLIPRGARITSARLRFFSASASPVSVAEEIKISGELVGDSAPFQAISNNLSSRNFTAATSWALGNDFPVEEESVTTPDLTAVIQQVVDQSDWCGGNAMSLFLESTRGEGGQPKVAIAADDGRGLAPQLVVNYDSSITAGCIGGESIYQVQSQANNLEENNSGNSQTGDILNMNPNSNQAIGVRFQNVRIPKNATIRSAKLVVTAFEDDDSNASMRISAIAQDDPADFSSGITNRLLNSPKTSSIPVLFPEFEQNREYDTPDLSNIVQQIVNRAGWENGNAMAFVFSDLVGDRAAYSFRGNGGRAVRFEVQFEGDSVPGSTQTVRDNLISIVGELTAGGNTPIVDTLYEATSYYAGNPVDFGLTRSPGVENFELRVRRTTRVSHELSYTGQPPVRPSGCTENNLSARECMDEFIPAGAIYNSPIEDLQCQTNNHIVLLSDGEPTRNFSVERIQSLLGIAECDGRNNGNELCGTDLVRNISNADESVVGTSVVTHTIGFELDTSEPGGRFLDNLASQGGGTFTSADNTDDLVRAFNTILQSVSDVSATFVSPGVAVNQLNRLTHRDELYYAVFEPDEGTAWPGNLKRYRISNNQVLDANNLPAIDSTTGFFADNSQSFWSLFADGAEVSEGGAASLLRPSRNLYVVRGNGEIITSENALNEDNTNLTIESLGIQDQPQPENFRNLLLRWARGIDVRDEDSDGDVTDVRFSMGDPIHSQPAVVDYSETETAIYVATNQGYLHSFDAETGLENFAIVPEQLLPNLQDFYNNQNTVNHTYGLDGPLVVRTEGNNRYLYVGMRRGGSSYFAFDISNSSRPSLMFSINAGDPGLEQMGQSWSEPVLTKVRINGSVRNVMILGGGYDESQDDKTTRSPDAVGNAVYIFDADSGALLWSASNSEATLNVSEMQYSIPGRVSVVDRDSDGLADHMYVADMGGQLFRFDIYNDTEGSDFVKGARIADFSGSTEENNRRFYYGPDIAQIAIGPDLYYAVAIGSGKRASPLNTAIEDRFYMLRDQAAFALDENGEYLFPPVATESDLYDATEGLLASADDSVVEIESGEFASLSGWLLDFSLAGEKVLASPIIIDHNIFFTTYIPPESNPSECGPGTGSSRAYLVSLLNANAVDFVNIPEDESENVAGRFAEVKLPGIPPEPTFSVRPPGNISLCLGTICRPTTTRDNEECVAGLGCLTSNIFKDRERVRKGSWRTETESQ